MPKPPASLTPLDGARRAEILAALAAGERIAAICRRLGTGRASVVRLHREVRPSEATPTGVVLHVRVSRDEARAFEALCRRDGVTKSARLRDLMRAAAGFTTLDAATLAEMAAARRELLAIGRNLNQIARAANSGRTILKGAELAQVQAMFREIQGFLLGLNGVIAAAKRRSPARVRQGEG